MAVQFLSTRSFPQRLKFIQVPPERIVMILQRPEDYACLMLHWSESSGGSFPCLGKECRMCDRAPVPYAYSSALLWHPGMRTWERSIMPIGDPARGFAQQDYTGISIKVQRTDRNDKHSPLRVVCREDAQGVARGALATPFDVRGHLLRRWGLFDEAALEGCDIHIPSAEEMAAAAAQEEAVRS